MFNEMEMLNSFSPEALKKWDKKKDHPYSHYDYSDKGAGVSYHSLPMTLLLRHLLYKDGDYLAMSLKEREDRAMDARIVLLSYLGEEKLPKKYFRAEAKKWHNGIKELFGVIAPDRKSAFYASKMKQVAEMKKRLDPKAASIYDFSVFHKQRDNLDFFCYDDLLSMAVAEGPLCVYGFRFKAHELFRIFRFYKQLGNDTKAKNDFRWHFAYCLYVYALQTRYGNENEWPYIRIPKRNFYILAGSRTARRGLEELMLLEKYGIEESPLEPYSAEEELDEEDEKTPSKFWAFRFKGYKYRGKDIWGHNAKEEVIIRYADDLPLDSEKGIILSNYDQNKEFIHYPSYTFDKKTFLDLVDKVMKEE